MRVILGLALIVFCAAQKPTPCETPKQWEAKRIKLDREKEFYDRGVYVYDEVNERKFEMDEVEQGKEREYYSTLRLYKEKKEYKTNLRTKKCNVTDIKYPWRPTAVPANATYVYEAEIGAAQIPNEHLTSVVWTGKFEDDAEYLIVVTTPDCVPITFEVTDPKTEEHFHEDYFDVHFGIKNASVFNIPPECM